MIIDNSFLWWPPWLKYGMDDNDIIVSDYLGKPYDYDEMLNN